MLYIPVSLVFFFIGSSLFAYYRARPEMLDEVKTQVAKEKLAAEKVGEDEAGYAAKLTQKAGGLTPVDVGDKVLPHFIVNKLPAGVAGLLIAAIFAAAMSSIDTSLNSSATVILSDIYKRYIRKDVDEKQSMRVLHGATLLWGALGTGVAVAMIGVKSVLDAWWKMSGVFAGGMLGLFLLGIVSRRTRWPAALTGGIIGILVILWMTFAPGPHDPPVWYQCPLDSLMTSTIGTLTILLVGLLISRFTRRSPRAV